MPIPWTLIKKDSTDSTMDDARAALMSGRKHGTVCLAKTQRTGRGRIPGRRWEDGKGALLFTAILHRDAVPTSYPLTQVLALALCRRLESVYRLDPRIKWPNDVLINRSKLAGILVETEGDYFLAGMGVNIRQRRFSQVLRRSAISLVSALEDGGKTFSAVPKPLDELFGLLAQVDAVLEENPGIEELEKRLYGRGEPVTVLLGDPSSQNLQKGKLQGLFPDGAMELVTQDNRVHRVYSGEIEFLGEIS